MSTSVYKKPRLIVTPGQNLLKTVATVYKFNTTQNNKVHKLIAAKADPNYTDASGRSPLHHIALNSNRPYDPHALLFSNNEVKLIDLLINVNADVNKVDGSQKTPLDTAIDNDNGFSAFHLMKNGGKTSDNSDPLNVAFKLNKMDVVKSLLVVKGGGDKSLPLPNKNTDLFRLAVRANNTQIMKSLIKETKDATDKYELINKKKDLFNHTPIHIAIGNNATESVELLLTEGAEISLTDIRNAAHYAPEVLKVLLQSNFVCDEIRKDRFKILDPEWTHRNSAKLIIDKFDIKHKENSEIKNEIVNFLPGNLVRGDDLLFSYLLNKYPDLINYQNDNGFTLLTSLFAKNFENNESFQKSFDLLIKKGVDLSLTDHNGQTPFMLSLNIKGSNKPKADAFIKNYVLDQIEEKSGVDNWINIQDNNGYTFLHHLLKNEKFTFELLKKALTKGADPWICAKDGTTPIMLAAQLGDFYHLGHNKSVLLKFKSHLKNNANNINKQNQKGFTALHYCTNLNNAKLLLENNANPKILTNRNESVLLLSMQLPEGLSSSELFDYYVENHKDLLKIKNSENLGPIELAAYRLNSKYFKCLYPLGLTIDFGSKADPNLLYFFAKYNKSSLLHALLDANPNVPLNTLVRESSEYDSNAYMMTPLYWAISNGSLQMVHTLLSAGAQLDPMNLLNGRITDDRTWGWADSETALGLALNLQEGILKNNMIHLLLQAQYELRNSDDMTPYIIDVLTSSTNPFAVRKLAESAKNWAVNQQGQNLIREQYRANLEKLSYYAMSAKNQSEIAINSSFDLNINNPYILYRHLDNVNDEDLYNHQIMEKVPLGNKSLALRLNLSGLRGRASKVVSLTVKDLSNEMTPALLKNLLNSLIAERDLLDTESYVAIRRTYNIQSLTTLINTISQSARINNLLTVSSKSDDKISHETFYLYSILSAISKNSSIKKQGQLLSDQSAALLLFFSEISGLCDTGLKETVFRYYISFCDSSNSPKAISSLETTIDSSIQNLLQATLEDENLVKKIAGGDIGQIAHLALYLKNRFSRQLGLIHKPVFDFHTTLIPKEFINKSNGHVGQQPTQDILDTIINELLPTKLIDTAKEAIKIGFNRNQVKYMELSNYCDDNQLQVDEHLDFSDDFKSLNGISDVLTLKILTAMGYLSFNEVSSMEIDEKEEEKQGTKRKEMA